MSFRTGLFGLLFSVAVAVSAAVDEFIVVVRHNGGDSIDKHLEKLPDDIRAQNHVSMLFTNLAAFNVHAYVTRNADIVERLRFDPSVEYIEKSASYSVVPAEEEEGGEIPEDGEDYVIPDFAKIGLTTFQSSDSACTIPYHHFKQIARIAEDEIPIPKAVVYVVGTGISKTHHTFEGRVQWGFDAVSMSGRDAGDLHGHGTYVAGLIGGKYHGIARKSTMIDVRALNENGVGSTVQILSALDYIAGQGRDKASDTMRLIHLSFTGERSVAIRDATRAVMDVAIVVAAIGDTSSYSCLTTPANIPDVMVVAGVDPMGNVMLPWSNFGECISVKAPGLLTSAVVPGSWTAASEARVHTSRGLEVKSTGSAGAAALITGLAALLNDYSEKDVNVAKATAGAIRRRNLVNFIKNGSMLHSQMYNDPTIHKYPYVPCMMIETDVNWNSTVERMMVTLRASTGNSHVFNHFERVRKQFMESSKHNS